MEQSSFKTKHYSQPAIKLCSTAYLILEQEGVTNYSRQISTKIHLKLWDTQAYFQHRL